MPSRAATSYRKSVGQAVRSRREGLGVSQEAFAYACRLHRTYIGRLERGEVNVGLDNLVNVARALGVPLSTLISEAESLA